MIKFTPLLITQVREKSGVALRTSHYSLLDITVNSAVSALGLRLFIQFIHISGHMKSKTGILGLILNLNFIPYLHSSSDNLQVDIIWHIRDTLYLCVIAHKDWFFSSPACMNLIAALLVVAFWYGNMFFLLKSLFCNTVTLWFQPSGEKERRGQNAVIIFYIYFYISTSKWQWKECPFEIKSCGKVLWRQHL